MPLSLRLLAAYLLLAPSRYNRVGSVRLLGGNASVPIEIAIAALTNCLQKLNIVANSVFLSFIYSSL